MGLNPPRELLTEIETIEKELARMRQGHWLTSTLTTLILVLCFSIVGPAQTLSNSVGIRKPTPTTNSRAAGAIDPADLNSSESEMRPIIEYYVVDRGSLQRSYPVAISPARRERFRKFYSDALERIHNLNFDSMSQEGKVDYILFRNHLEHELRQLDIEEKQLAEVGPLLPFADTIIGLEEARRRMEPMDSAKTAAGLNNLKKQIDEARKSVEARLPNERRGAVDVPASSNRIKKTVGYRALGVLNNLRNALRNWYTFYNGYDPLFTWWNEEPYKAIDQALTGYSSFLSERVVGIRAEGAQPGSTIPAQNRGPNTGQSGGQGAQRPGVAAPRAGDTSDIGVRPLQEYAAALWATRR